MSLTKKERVRRALLQQPVDRLPTQINYTQSLGESMAVHFGVDQEELPAHLDNHILRVDIQHRPALSADGKTRYDWWGVGFDTQQEGYFASYHPLRDATNLEGFTWPDPHAPGLFDSAAEIIEKDAGGHFIVPNFGFALFERAWALYGFEPFLRDMAYAPDFVESLLDRILDIQLVLIHRFIQLGVDGGYFGDDYGAQKNMLFSPRMWRKFIKPRLARLFAPFREAGLPVLMHSDGQIQPIISDLVEIGLTALNPVQPEVLDQDGLRATFGDELAYYGGISTQTVLPHGTPEQIIDAVRQCICRLAPQNTGLILSPSHRMMTDVPLKNIDVLINTFSALGD